MTEYETIMKSVLEDPNWEEKLCTTNEGERIKYIKSEEEVILLSQLRPTGTCYEKDTVDAIIFYAIFTNTSKIEKWVKSKEWTYKIIVDIKSPVGYVLVDGVRKETSCVQVTLRRSINRDSDHGFFVSSVHPIIDAE